MSSVVESSSASYLTQKCSTMLHDSLTNPGEYLSTGDLDIPSSKTAYLKEEVSSTWSNTNIVHSVE